MKPCGSPANSTVETIAIALATVGVIMALFLPGLAMAFAFIAGIVHFLNLRDDPRNAKRTPDPP
jgi:hypothetical protein